MMQESYGKAFNAKVGGSRQPNGEKYFSGRCSDAYMSIKNPSRRRGGVSAA